MGHFLTPLLLGVKCSFFEFYELYAYPIVVFQYFTAITYRFVTHSVLQAP